MASLRNSSLITQWNILSPRTRWSQNGWYFVVSGWLDIQMLWIASIIKGYDEMDASDAEHVSDVLVKVGQEYAISAEALMATFQRGDTALHTFGTDFEKSAALFAATNVSLQNAETTGTI